MKIILNLRNKLKTDDGKSLLINFLSLSSLQLVNYVLPLIIIPYLFSKLGADKFGLIIFAQSIVFYFTLVINYGLTLLAVKKISINRANKLALSNIYSNIFYVKVILLVFMFILYYLMISSIDYFNEEKLLYLFSFGIVIESLFFPAWFFQGMEKMKYITIIYAISKIIVTIMIFFVVDSNVDYELVPLLYFLGSIISGVIAQWIIFMNFKVKLTFPNIVEISKYFKEGWHFFVSNLATNMYRNINIVLLGIISTTQYVGYYALAEKIIKAIQSLMIPITETLFPYIVKTNETQNIKESLTRLFKISKYYLFILIITFIFVFIMAEYIVLFIAGENIKDIVLDLKILSFVIIFGGMNYLIGIIGLIAMGYERFYMKVVIYTGIINIFLCLFLSYFFNDLGAIIALTTAELFLLIMFMKKLFDLSNETKN